MKKTELILRETYLHEEEPQRKAAFSAILTEYLHQNSRPDFDLDPGSGQGHPTAHG